MARHVETATGSQPSCRREAARRFDGVRAALPRDGERVAVFGCGTSPYVAKAKRLAAARALAKGPGPNRPRSLTRSVVLS